VQQILSYPPSQTLTSEDKDLIWKFRFYLIRDKRGLTKFLKSVTWRDPIEVKQAVEELLPQWTEIDMDDALELLGPGTVDSRVRAFAVRQLSRADDEVNDDDGFHCRGNETENITGARALPLAAGTSPQV
jgi:phosphatidylinositol 3-kinase